jgi:hypothetical protein
LAGATDGHGGISGVIFSDRKRLRTTKCFDPPMEWVGFLLIR